MERLTAELETQSLANPSGYRRRVALLALLGYGYLFGVVLVLVTAIAGLAWLGAANRSGLFLIFQIILVLGILLLFVLRTLCMRIPAPEGRILAPYESPELFATVRAIQTKLQCPKVDKILVNLENNACLATRPWFGLLGPSQSYLVLGLPLILNAPPDEVRSLIAHELGHHSRLHSKSTVRIYRIRTAWFWIASVLHQERHWGSFLFRRFFDWYAPYFGAWSQVLSRAHEFEADRIAAECESNESCARMMARTEVLDRFLNRDFWPTIAQESPESEVPPPDLFLRMQRGWSDFLRTEKPNDYLAEAIQVRTAFGDSHPSFRERMESFGISPQVPCALEPSESALQLLGKAGPAIVEELSRQIQQELQTNWTSIQESERAERDLLISLSAKVQAETATPEELTTYGERIFQREGLVPALVYFRKAVEKDSERAASLFTYGSALLQSNDDAGLAWLRDAAKRNPGFGVAAYDFMIRWLRERNRDGEAQSLYPQFDDFQAMEMAAADERSRITPKDDFQPHELRPESVASIRSQLALEDAVIEGWLAKKSVKNFPDRPVYVLCVRRKSSWWKVESSTRNTKFAQHLASTLRFPGEFFVLVLCGETKKLVQKIQALDDARIYSAT